MNNEEKYRIEFQNFKSKYYSCDKDKNHFGQYVSIEGRVAWEHYLEACRQRQSEIERLKKELQATREQLEKCESGLNNYAICDDVGAVARRYFNDKQKYEV